MTDVEFASYIVEFIEHFGCARQALKAAQATPVPYKLRKAKELLKKLIRTYIYFTEQS